MYSSHKILEYMIIWLYFILKKNNIFNSCFKIIYIFNKKLLNQNIIYFLSIKLFGNFKIIISFKLLIKYLFMFI